MPSCKKCGKEFEYPSFLQRHTNKKTDCRLRLEPATGSDLRFVCKPCNRPFANKQNLNRHRAICPVASRGEAGYVAALAAQESERRIITAADNGSQAGISVNNNDGKQMNYIGNNGQNIDQSIVNNITLNIFGQEDFSKLDNECIFGRILKSDLMCDAWMEIVTMCYGQEEENRTIYIKDRRRVKVLVSMGDGIWRETPLKEMQTKCLGVARDLLYERRGRVDVGRWTPIQELEKVLQHLFDIVNCDDVTEEVLKQTLNSFKGVLLENRDYLKKTNAIRREVKDPSETLGDKQ